MTGWWVAAFYLSSFGMGWVAQEYRIGGLYETRRALKRSRREYRELLDLVSPVELSSEAVSLVRGDGA